MNELEQENARLRREVSSLRWQREQDRDAIRSLLSNGQLLDIEDVRARIAAGGPHLPQLLELEREMAETELGFHETMANPIPFQSVIDHAVQLLEAEHDGR